MTTVSLILICPAEDREQVNRILEEQGHGPDNLSIPLAKGTHYACHWWTDMPTLQALTLPRVHFIVNRAEDTPVPLSVLNQIIGDSLTLTHKRFSNRRWGWRAELQLSTPDLFDPSTKGIKVYTHSDFHKIDYTSAPFEYDEALQLWVIEHNEQRWRAQDVHYNLNFDTGRHARGTLKQYQEFSAVFLRFA